MSVKSKFYSLLCAAAFVALPAAAEYEFSAGADLFAGAGSGDFAPYYLRTNRHGKITQSKNVLLGIHASDPLDNARRFDFSWGIEALGGYSSTVDYMRYEAERGWVLNPQKPAAVWLQQLYAEVKWRCLYLSAGLKDRNSVFVDQQLSSGDVIWSGNSRSIPEVRVGFVDFQDIPLTNHWVQADLCLSYGKFVDTDWINNHYSYYSFWRNPGSLWTYKRIYLRSNPAERFCFQLGFQMTGIFGGTTFYYSKGIEFARHDNYGGLKDFFQMLLPLESGREGYMTGDHKGSWDIAARYTLRSGDTLRAYTQWFWEDGTSLLKKNGWDGLWGLEFKRSDRWWIDGAVVEYLDFTNQSGPLHWDPSQLADGQNLTAQVRGNDNYYNNLFYRSYVNYGLTIGNPMMTGILYNVDGCPIIRYNKVRGVHVALKGSIGNDFDWTLKYGHRKAWGRTNTPELIHPVQTNSWLVAADWHPSAPRLQGLAVSAEFGIDSQGLPGRACGFMVGVSYDRLFSFGSRNAK